MNTVKDYCQQLIDLATHTQHRFGVVLKGDANWTEQTLDQIFSFYTERAVFQLGGDEKNLTAKYAAFNKGQQLLGQECSLLVCDFSSGFDANSFTAATGCVVGGGLVVIVAPSDEQTGYEMQWLNRCLASLVLFEQGRVLPPLPSTSFLLTPLTSTQTDENRSSESRRFEQQELAVEKICKVVEGHRKRPLAMTADRGRGKSSALGIAAAKLMQERSLNIVVTAPSLAAVQPLFEHAAKRLPNATIQKSGIEYEGSSLQFIAPDELLQNQTQCDLLFVDEASAIPVPMLQSMVERFHRAVFSTTIHGYEGCGRGFTLKFQQWLKENRPGSVFYHIHQPIRWAEGDPLEQWLFDTFLLNAELLPATSSSSVTHFERIEKQGLLANPQKLHSVFALLVHAHYQTTPNDLMTLLQDDAITLFAQFEGQVCIGCVLTVDEGNLDRDLIAQIQLGKRRPKGHLVPVLLANQLGLTDAATQTSLRVMRIAVHPDRQRQGLGREMISQLSKLEPYHYVSTSFGATSELVQFWRHCGFEAIKLGSQRDSASGTYSLVMMKGEPEYIESVAKFFQPSFHYSLSELYSELEIELVRNLLALNDASVVKPSVQPLLMNYCDGGSSYDSVAPLLDSWWRESPAVLAFATDLYIRRVVQRRSWQQCSEEFNLAGRKQTERQFRQDLSLLFEAIS